MLEITFIVLIMLICAWWFMRRLRYDFVFKKATKKLLEKQGGFFSSFELQKLIKRNINHKAKLADLLQGKNPEKKKNSLAQIMFKKNGQMAALEKYAKQNPKNLEAQIELASLYLTGERKDCAQKILDQLEQTKLGEYSEAKRAYLLSFFDTSNGDLESASKNCSKAISLFNGQKAYFEEGKTLLQMGIIYKLSTLCDVAQMMFEGALRIFKFLDLPNQIAEGYGNLGMLMTFQERFEEAEDYFKKAHLIFEGHNNILAKAEIINQQALSELLKKQNNSALKLAKLALETHKRIGNKKGEAFSLEILCHIHMNKKMFAKAHKNALLAKEKYGSENPSAFLECSYLEAFALFLMNEKDSSEIKLREIIELHKNVQSCFHIANVYSLLGLIFLQKGEMQRAKGLFQQSLGFEQRNNRLNGIANDYANIALIEKNCGNFEQAKKTWEAALEYATACGDEAFCEIIDNKLEALRNPN